MEQMTFGPNKTHYLVTDYIHSSI